MKPETVRDTYIVLDLNACLKHSYFGSDKESTLLDKDTGERVIPWESGARSFLSRYIEPNKNELRFMIAAYDRGREYRTKLYPDYKKPREERQDKESKLQRDQWVKLKAWALELLPQIGVTLASCEGVEADDVIAYLCTAQSCNFHVHTVDADLLQLCAENVAVSLKGEIFTAGSLYKDRPVESTSVVKSLLGDSSDNYPGVKGFGPKALESLVEAVGWDGLKELEAIAMMEGSAGLDTLQTAVNQNPQCSALAKIMGSFSEWQVQYDLARLHPELCWKPSIRAKNIPKTDFVKRVPNLVACSRIMSIAGIETDEFFPKALFPNLHGLDKSGWEKYKERIWNAMKQSEFIAFDYESTDKKQYKNLREASNKDDFVDVLSQDITGVSFCFGAQHQHTIYLPVDHAQTENISKEEILNLFLRIEEQGIRLVAHNAFFEGVLTRTNLGMALECVWDTRIMQRYVDENASAHLKDMSGVYLDYHQATYEETTGGRRMNELTLNEVVKYGCEDSLVTAHLCDLLMLLMSLDGCKDHYKKIAVRPTEALQMSYINGVNFDKEAHAKLIEADKILLESSVAKLRELLAKHVTGEPTKGAMSLFNSEKAYVFKAELKKTGDIEKARQARDKFLNKLKDGCRYTPYSEVEVEIEFKYTLTGVCQVLGAVGLQPLLKFTRTAVSEYLKETVGQNSDQARVLAVLSACHNNRVDKIKTNPTAMATRSLQNLGELWKEFIHPEPKIIRSGDELNFGSPAQMKELLYCKLDVPVRLYGTQISKTRMHLGIMQGSPSTDEKAIQMALANDVEKGSWKAEALATLLEGKKASTRLGLFHRPWPLYIYPDGKIHPLFLDSGTDTRRPTGSSPNLLQVPSHGDGEFMRKPFRPPYEDWVCVGIDFSGQELRILASECKDPVMIEAYAPGRERDIHSVTATGIARGKGVTELEDFARLNAARKDESDPLFHEADRFRKSAKIVNFGLAYMAGGGTVSRNLSISVEEAYDLINSTVALYTGLRPWQQKVSDFMRDNGFTVTAWGTKRHATDKVLSSDPEVSSRQMRQGVNATIQGAAAECLKFILTEMVKTHMFNRLRVQFAFPIYDEVVSWVHKDDVVAYWNEMKDIMVRSTPPGHIVKQMPELSVGPDWGSLKEMGYYCSDTDITNLVSQIC